MSLNIDTPASSQEVLCHYINDSNQLQIARLANSDFKLEKVVFPGQRLLFLANPNAQLEIQTETSRTSVLAEPTECS